MSFKYWRHVAISLKALYLLSALFALVFPWSLVLPEAHAATIIVIDASSCAAIGGAFVGSTCTVVNHTVNAADTLEIAPGVSLEIIGNFVNDGIMIANGPVTIVPGASLTNNNDLELNAGSNNFGTLNNSLGATLLINGGGNFNTGVVVNAGNFGINGPLGHFTNNSGGLFDNTTGNVTNTGQFDNLCGAAYMGPDAAPNPVNFMPCNGTAPPFSVPFPLDPEDAICTPLIMNTDVAATESWYVKAAGGPLEVEVTAFSVNSVDGETVVATAFDPLNNPVGTVMVSYPPGTPAGSSVTSSIPPFPATAGDIYRIDITTPFTPPTQPHYALDFYGGTEAGIGSPTFPSLEDSGQAKWILNQNPAEPFIVDFFVTGVPTPATSVTFQLTDPTGTLLPVTTVPVGAGNEISMPGTPGAWILHIININGHYRLDRPSAADPGIYVSGISTPQCNFPDIKVTKSGPASVQTGGIIHYDIHVENIGYKDATGVMVTDVIPIEMVGLSLTSASPICGPLTGGQIECNVGNLAVDSFFDVFIELQLPQGPTGMLTNNAFATSTSQDPNPTNDASQAITPVAPAGGGGGGTFCNDQTIEDLIASGFYNIIDNRGGPAGAFAGTGGPDLFLAGDFGDQFYGLDGDDCGIGGLARDLFSGGEGNDQFFGQGGDDHLKGGNGNDVVNGGDGDDVMSGGAGDDSMQGDEGSDSIKGDSGNDTMSGGNGADRLSGGADNDNMFGDADSDQITGRSGNDTINCGPGADNAAGDDGVPATNPADVDTLDASCEIANPF
jgi:uncharacterized repeat protein (TIGR01451 family)